MSFPSIAMKPISRRRLFRGLGVSLAVPLLDCMTPVFGSTGRTSPKRMLLISNNLGVLPEPFFPQDSGADYTLSPYLEELREFRNDFTVFSGLSHPAVFGGHSTENCFLTAARDPTRSGFRNSLSLDQFAAETLGQQTRFPTLNLGVNIDRANRSLSWTRDGALLPAEDSPAALYRRMFVQGTETEINRRVDQLRQRGSILDAVAEDTRAFSLRLGSSDRRRLDQYFTSVRELEERLHDAGEWERQAKPTTDHAGPTDVPDKAKFFEKLKLMLSMAHLALESDSTRIVTLMIDAFATPVFEIDADERSLNDYHNLSHHGKAKDKVAQLTKVDHHHMRLFAELLGSLAQSPDGENDLLQHTMVLYGSNMGNSNTHDNTNLPIILAGGGFTHGQHLAFDRHQNTPLCNLFVSLLQRLGVDADSFASSTGTLTGLSAG